MIGFERALREYESHCGDDDWNCVREEEEYDGLDIFVRGDDYDVD